MSGDPGEPVGLGDAGRALWRSVVADIAENWRLDAKDWALLEAACTAADRAAVLECVVDEGAGIMITGSTGQQVLHPAIAEARQQRSLMMSLLAKVEIAPPAPKTGHLNGRQRAALRSAAVRGQNGG